MANSLEALCDLLDEDEDFQEESPENVDQGKDEPDASHDEDEGDVAEEERVAEKETEGEAENIEDMEKQIKLMQEQMARMQNTLENKKKQRVMASQPKPSQSSETSKSPSGSFSFNRQVLKKSVSELSEVDMFKKEKVGSAAPKSTQLFNSEDRKETKFHDSNGKFGPKLPATNTRILSGKEKARLFKQLENKDKESSILNNLVREDLADSSDEEEKGCSGSKYNSFGKDVRRISRMSQSTSSERQTSLNQSEKIGFNQIKGNTLNLSSKSKNDLLTKNVIVERFSKLKVSRPLMDNATIEAHMLGITFIPIYRIKEAAARQEIQGNWSTIGVLYYKSNQTSKNGNTYTMWKLTDLFGDIKTITVLLFGKCHNVHYKMPSHKVLGILNAKVLDNTKGNGKYTSEITLSLDHPDKVLELGDSVDLGKCKAKKKDGSGCTSLVNLSNCEFCQFHVQKAYREISSSRSDLQSSFSGGNAGVRSRIMNKIDPKGNYFGGGQTINNYTPTPAQRSEKFLTKEAESLKKLGITPDDKILQSEEKQKKALKVFHEHGKANYTSHLNKDEKDVVRNFAHDVSAEFGMRLLNPTPGARNLIKTLKKHSDDPIENKKLTVREKKEAEQKLAQKMLFEHKQKLAQERARKTLMERQLSSVPKLGRGFNPGDSIDLSLSSTSNKDSKKVKALQILKGKKIEKADQNFVSQSKKRKRLSLQDQEKSQKRVALALDKPLSADTNSQSNRSEEKTSVASCGEVMSKDRMERIKNAKSRNEGLVSDYQDEKIDKNFAILEKKEQMEEKMLQTKEILTKAMTCNICNYTSFVQSDLCRKSGHRAKIIQVKKRFFECCNCKNRTFALDKYPSQSCKKCGSTKWKRCGMIREKKGPTLESEKLLIRGVEQKFIGQDVKSSEMCLDSNLS